MRKEVGDEIFLAAAPHDLTRAVRVEPGMSERLSEYQGETTPRTVGIPAREPLSCPRAIFYSTSSVAD